jgi:hypothetical protein
MWIKREFRVRYFINSKAKVNLISVYMQQNSTYPDAGYPDLLGPSGKSVENSIEVNKEGVGPSKHNWFMYYSVYYAHDDMFRPL